MQRQIVNKSRSEPPPAAHAEGSVCPNPCFMQFPLQGIERFWFSDPGYFDLAREARSFVALSAYIRAGAAISTRERPIRALATYSTVTLAETLGVAPARALVHRRRGRPRAERLAGLVAAGANATQERPRSSATIWQAAQVALYDASEDVPDKAA